MTSPYAPSAYGYPQGGFGDPQFDRDAASSMFDLQTQMKVKELEQQFRLGKDEISARLKIAGQNSRDTRYGIDSQRDSEREKLAHLRDEMERVGIPRMLIEKYTAEKTYEIALSEMSLKRDVFVEETAQAREKLKLDREQMERIGIPRVEIERYTAEQNAKIAQAQQTGYYGGQSTLAREQFASDAEYKAAQAAESARQFNTTASGYLQPGPGGSGGPGGATLDRERFEADQAERQRRYGLDVSKFGAELASTPDTYFQGRRFQGVDVPRLLGGAGAATQDVAGGPTPGVATMGAYLGGYDPYGAPPAAPAAGGGPALGAPVAGPGAPAPGAPLSAEEQSRYTQLQARARQLQMAGEPVPPGDADELARFQARMGPPRIEPGPGPAAPGAAPLSAQEQARFQELTARREQVGAAGGELDPADLDELQRFLQRGAQGPTPTFTMPPGGYGGYQPGGPSLAPGGGGGYGGQPISQAPTSYDEGAGQGWQPPGGWQPGDFEQRQMISDPGWQAPRGDPFAARMAAGGGGGYGEPMPRGGGIGGGFSETAGPTASVYGGPAVSASVGPQGYRMPAWYTQQASRQPSPYPSQDPRQKQVAALAKALPPSPYDGLNEQDSAALHAMSAIYKSGGQSMARGEYERLAGSGRLGLLQSAGRLLGHDPRELESQYKSYAPAQGSSRLAG